MIFGRHNVEKWVGTMDYIKSNFQFPNKVDHLKQLLKEHYNFFCWTSDLQYRTTWIIFRWPISPTKIINGYHTSILTQAVNRQYVQNTHFFRSLIRQKKYRQKNCHFRSWIIFQSNISNWRRITTTAYTVLND
jgi:hypothetical protein